MISSVQQKNVMGVSRHTGRTPADERRECQNDPTEIPVMDRSMVQPEEGKIQRRIPLRVAEETQPCGHPDPETLASGLVRKQPSGILSNPSLRQFVILVPVNEKPIACKGYLFEGSELVVSELYLFLHICQLEFFEQKNFFFFTKAICLTLRFIYLESHNTG